MTKSLIIPSESALRKIVGSTSSADLGRIFRSLSKAAPSRRDGGKVIGEDECVVLAHVETSALRRMSRQWCIARTFSHSLEKVGRVAISRKSTGKDSMATLLATAKCLSQSSGVETPSVVVAVAVVVASMLL
jgi:hypothetical protein